MSGCWLGLRTLGLSLALLAESSMIAAESPQNSMDPPKKPLIPQKPGMGLGTSGNSKTGDQLVKVTVSANTQIISPGETFFLSFLFEIEPHWHIYWKNPGTSGAPTEVKISAPAGFQVGPTLFPRPTAFIEEEGATYGYQDKVALFVEVTAPNDVPSGTVMFNAKVNWLVCKEVCLLGHASQVLTLNTKPSTGGGSLGAPPKQSSTTGPRSAMAASFQDAFVQKCYHRLPEPLTDQPSAEISFDKKSLIIKTPAQGLHDASFFPIECPGVALGEPKVNGAGDQLVLTIPVDINPQNSQGRSPVAAGMIALGKSLDDPCYEFELRLSTP